jgi:sugar phosphate isomerase/epimerase
MKNDFQPLALGLVSDEVCPDFAEAVAFGLERGIELYEIRVVNSGRIPNIDPQEFEAIKATVKQTGIKVTALSPGIFKHEVHQTEALDHELEVVLPKTIAMAKQLDCPMIIAFGFHQNEQAYDDQAAIGRSYMGRAADLCAEAGLTLTIENEPGFICDTGTRTAAFIQAINKPNLKANWDPCNSWGMEEEPFPDGYEVIKPYIGNVHIKDTALGGLVKCVPVGEGKIDWDGQMKALVRDQVVRHATIETHCEPLKENTDHNIRLIRKMMEG